MLMISNYSCARRSVSSLVSNNLVYQSDTGASVRPAVHVVHMYPFCNSSSVLEIGPQGPNIDDKLFLCFVKFRKPSNQCTERKQTSKEGMF